MYLKLMKYSFEKLTKAYHNSCGIRLDFFGPLCHVFLHTANRLSGSVTGVKNFDELSVISL